MFLEKEFIFKKNSGSKVELQEVQEPQTPIQDSMKMDNDSQEVVESEPIVGFLMQLITLISSGRHEKHSRIASHIV